MDLQASVLAFTERHGLFSPGEQVLVGVSGGPDSLCLLYILAGLREELSLRLHAAPGALRRSTRLYRRSRNA